MYVLITEHEIIKCFNTKNSMYTDLFLLTVGNMKKSKSSISDLTYNTLVFRNIESADLKSALPEF